MKMTYHAHFFSLMIAAVTLLATNPVNGGYLLGGGGGGCGCGPPPPVCPPMLPPPICAPLPPPCPILPPCPPMPICPLPLPPLPCPPPIPCPPPFPCPPLLPPPPPCPPPMPCGCMPQPYAPPPMAYAVAPPTNDCCCQCGQPCRFRSHRMRSHGARIFSAATADVEEDPTCNSVKLKAVIVENISKDPTTSKRAIQAAAEERLFAKVNVICAKGDFSYVAYTDTYCQASAGDITCYAFLPMTGNAPSGARGAGEGGGRGRTNAEAKGEGHV